MKKRQKQLFTFVMMMVGAGVGFTAATFGMKWVKALPPSQLGVLLIFIIPGFFFVIAIHEAGHALAGSIVKFDLRMYVVGPLMWDKEESGWRFKWNKNVNLSGGMVVSLPTTTENLANRFSVYALGGPAASLIFAVLAYCVHIVMSSINTSGLGHLNVLASFCLTLSLLSFFIFVATILPFHMNGFYTDGARAFRFLRGGDTSRFEVLLLKIITSSTSGVRPNQLNASEVHEALSLSQKLNAPMGVYLHSYLYHIAFDQGNFDDAEKNLKDYIAQIESIPTGIRGGVFLDATFFYAYVLCDLDQAEKYWEQYVPSAILPKAQVFAAEAAMLMLKDERILAEKKIELALKELANMLDRGVSKSLGDKLMHMKDNKHNYRLD